MIDTLILNEKEIKDKIHTFRGVQVILDSNLARMYEVETKKLNQAVKRNIERFPQDFMFQLTQEEFNSLRSQFVTLEKGRGEHKKYLPYAFTEHGVAALAGILKSKKAVEVNISVIRAFVSMRRMFQSSYLINHRLDNIEKKQLVYDLRLDELFSRFDTDYPNKKEGVFFENSMFDAHIFVSDLIKLAKKSIILIDNYVDYNTLSFFSILNGISITILTKNINSNLKSSINKFNNQHRNKVEISIKYFDLSHDRFLIIDSNPLYIYHIGCSLKDIGKKWTTITKLETLSINNKIIELTTKNN